MVLDHARGLGVMHGAHGVHCRRCKLDCYAQKRTALSSSSDETQGLSVAYESNMALVVLASIVALANTTAVRPRPGRLLLCADSYH